ncbi:DUF4974 domain-containing protein [Chitinophaga sp. SYP-B3965]|uniref:FecR family protein n=1 Tax=Chitinophaga sp. SYP-B3965 TaxID=2663120 RepID=UPI001299CCAC|nr:FecR family protein [Chitinophaga sp. SYP-B3965]MRG44104.1 DUF4974 domain-containing protein [Chitinophaga sp. SYP-B3965]
MKEHIMQTEQRFRELLDRYIAGTCTPQEKTIIEEWFEKGGDVNKADLHLSAADESRLLANIHRKQGARLRTLLRTAAIWAGILIATGLGIWKATEKPENIQPVFMAIATGKGEIKQVTLPDGSVVLLNANSRLYYHPDFSSHRQLRLSGEALFTVTHDKSHPFTVLTADSLSTTVLGTQFNINSYDKGDDIQISVLSGKVAVKKPGSLPDTLIKAQALRYHKADGKFAVLHDVTTETNWSKGQWEYENVRFSDLALLLENQYGITLTSLLDPKELQTNVSINFSKKQTAREIMEVFCSLAGCRFRMLSPEKIEIY